MGTTDSRMTSTHGRRRRYACFECGHRMTTYELPAEDIPQAYWSKAREQRVRADFAPPGSLTRRCLDALSEFPGIGMTSLEVADELGEDRRVAATTLSDLHLRGYIQRRPASEDSGHRYEYFVEEQGNDAAD